LSLAGTILGMDSGTRLASLLASIILHAAVLISIPLPIGENSSGPAQSDSALHITVERSRLSDNPPQEQSAPQSMEQPLEPQQREGALALSGETQPQQITQPPVAMELRVKSEPATILASIATHPIEELPASTPVITTEASDSAEKPESIKRPRHATEPTVRPEVKLKTKPASAKASSPTPPAEVKSARTTVKKPVQVATSGKSRRLSRDYRSTLLRLIERNKYYPLRARRRGMEGKAMVGFSVQRNGEIRNIALSRSSRKPLLDQAALQTIKRMGKAPPLPNGMKRSSWRFVVPISYNIR